MARKRAVGAPPEEAEAPMVSEERKAGEKARKKLEKAAKVFSDFRPARAVLERVEAVPTCFPWVDWATRVGGWPTRRFALVHGPSSEGKTAFVLGLVKSFLLRGHLALFADAERTTPIDWAEKLMGTLVDHPFFFAEKPNAYEELIARTRAFCNRLRDAREAGTVPPETRAIVVVDSLDKLMPRNLMEEVKKAIADEDAARKLGEKITAGRDRSGMLKAKMNKAWMMELTSLLDESGACLVAIARESQKLDAQEWEKKGGLDYALTGGKDPYFEASIVARIERDSYVQEKVGDEDTPKVVYGEKHRVTIRKSKVGSKEGKWTRAYFHTSNGQLYEAGFDPARDLLDLGLKFGVLEKSGAWYSFEGERIGNGLHACAKVLSSNAGWMALIEAAVRGKFEAVAPAEFDPETGEVE